MAILKLRRDQPVPLYYQIEVDMRRAIENGELPEGRLPTEGELGERYGVSRMTVRAALGRLEEDGLIERHRARGTFVRPDALSKIVRHPNRLLGFEDDLRRQGAQPQVDVLAVEQIEPPSAIARILRLAPGQRAYRVRRRGIVNGEPLWTEARYYPREIGSWLTRRDLRGASLTTLLENALGTPIAAARVRIESASANSRQAHLLGVRQGHPLLVNQFTFFDGSGRALEVLRAAFRGDRYAISVELPRASSGTTWFDEARATQWPSLTTHLDSEPAGEPATPEEEIG